MRVNRVMNRVTLVWDNGTTDNFVLEANEMVLDVQPEWDARIGAAARPSVVQAAADARQWLSTRIVSRWIPVLDAELVAADPEPFDLAVVE